MKSVRESAGMRLAVLFGSFFFMLLLSGIIAVAMNKMPGDVRTHALAAAGVQCVLGFCVPAFLLARFSSNNPMKWLHLTKLPPLKALFGVVLVYIFSLPAMEWLIEWNANLHLPQSMSTLETMLRNWETSAEESTKILLETNGLLSILAGVMVIGVFTGFSEELFFRGGLQGIFARSSVGTNASVWLAAFVFSAMHFQFFGFIPRLLMGVFFGYLLIWTRSLWVPVFAHTLNNSVVVILSAITGETNASILEAYPTAIDFGSNIPVIASVALTVIFLVLFRDSIFKTPQQRNKWQKKQHLQASGK